MAQRFDEKLIREKNGHLARDVLDTWQMESDMAGPGVLNRMARFVPVLICRDLIWCAFFLNFARNMTDHIIISIMFLGVPLLQDGDDATSNLVVTGSPSALEPDIECLG